MARLSRALLAVDHRHAVAASHRRDFHRGDHGVADKSIPGFHRTVRQIQAGVIPGLVAHLIVGIDHLGTVPQVGSIHRGQVAVVEDAHPQQGGREQQNRHRPGILSPPQRRHGTDTDHYQQQGAQ